MLRHYCGEYLISPVPLHYGLNWCSHNCFYCFANLNKPDRRTQNSSIKKFGAAMRGEDDTIEGKLLRAGMPVLISNDSDPFAKSNEGVFLPVYEEMQRHGITAAIQTKGGNIELENMVLNGNKTMFYISLTSDDNEFLKVAEPSAPSYEHRINLIKRAIEHGHFVVVGINPLVPAWWNDFNGVIKKLDSIGVERVWIGDLHLSADQIKNLPEKRKAQFMGDIKQGMKKSRAGGYDEMEAQLNKKFNVFSFGESSRGNFWGDYGQGIKTMDCFKHYLTAICQDNNVNDIAVSFEFACNYLIPDALKNVRASKFKELIKPFRRTVYNKMGSEPESKIRTIQDVMGFYWDIASYPSPLRKDCFSILSDDGMDITDDNGNNYLVFSVYPNQYTRFQDNDNLIFI